MPATGFFAPSLFLTLSHTALGSEIDLAGAHTQINATEWVRALRDRERDTLFIRRTWERGARRERCGCGSNTSPIGRPAGRHPPCCYCETHTTTHTHPLIIFGTALSMCLPLRALLPDTIFDWVQKMSPRCDPCFNAHVRAAYVAHYLAFVFIRYCDIDWREPLFEVNQYSIILCFTPKIGDYIFVF
jgi:hypothetical protein